MCTGSFPEILSQAISVGTILVGRLGASEALVAAAALAVPLLVRRWRQ